MAVYSCSGRCIMDVNAVGWGVRLSTLESALPYGIFCDELRMKLRISQ